MTPMGAYIFAGENPNCDIGKYQKIACQELGSAYRFALDIPEANIEYCYSFINILTRKAISDFILKDL